MSNLKTRDDVIERYWPNYLDMCMRSQENKDFPEFRKEPTIDGFWQWYITKGPMGLKHKGQFFNEDDTKYV